MTRFEAAGEASQQSIQSSNASFSAQNLGERQSNSLSSSSSSRRDSLSHRLFSISILGLQNPPLSPLLSYWIPSPNPRRQSGLPPLVESMDVINAKLWDKYRNLKKRKVAEREESSAEVEGFVRKYQRAMVGMVEALQTENDELRNQILVKEDEYAESQKLLTEEKRKTKELSSEIEKIRNLAIPRKDFLEENGCMEIVAPDLFEYTPEFSSKDSHRKTSVKLLSKSPIGHECAQNGDDDITCPCKDQYMPDCCRRIIAMAGKTENPREKCVFQILLESIVGLQFFIDVQADVPHFSVVHQSSGYSFKLTWLPSLKENDGEWFYQVSSLGTLERVALEWMKEDIVFGSTMFPLFCQRISRALGGAQ